MADCRPRSYASVDDLGAELAQARPALLLLTLRPGEGSPVADAVVHRAKTSAVETVLVAGEAVPRDGQFTRVNKADMLEALAASLRAPLQPAEERRRALSPAVFPYVKHFYDGWLDEKARDPFYRPSSRH